MELEETLTLHLTKSQRQRAGPNEQVWSPPLIRDVLVSLTNPALPKTLTSSDSPVSASNGVLIYILIHTLTHMLTYTHSYKYTCSHTHSQTHTLTHTHAYIYIFIHIYMLTLIHM